MLTNLHAAWKIAVSSKNMPTALVISTSKLDLFFEHHAELAIEGVEKGAYIVSPATKEQADAILISNRF